jgi:hypothetical protein
MRCIMASPLCSYKHSLSIRYFKIKIPSVRERERRQTRAMFIQHIFIVGAVLLHETPGRYALLLEAGLFNCSSFARKTACIREMQSNRTMPAVTHNHCIHNHHASYQVLQSISLHGRLAALVCLAILAKHGLWNDRLLVC